MVKSSQKIRSGIRWASIFTAIFILLFAVCLTNAIRRGDDEPKLILVFFGYPASWFVISIFHSFLEWLGPFGSLSRRIAEWVFLILAGTIQYSLIGFMIGYYMGNQEKSVTAENGNDG